MSVRVCTVGYERRAASNRRNDVTTPGNFRAIRRGLGAVVAEIQAGTFGTAYRGSSLGTSCESSRTWEFGFSRHQMASTSEEGGTGDAMLHGPFTFRRPAATNDRPTQPVDKAFGVARTSNRRETWRDIVPNIRWRYGRAEEAGKMRVIVSLVAAVALAPSAARAQHDQHVPPEAEHGAMTDELSTPLGIPSSREGSGTSWLPDASPMYMLDWRAGDLELDAMWNVFLQYVDERGRRGKQQLGSVNWVMGMARRSIGGGQSRGRVMLSLEPLTVGRCGYPDLLATGELCRGEPLHDRQHPHDTFMELSAGYAHALGTSVAADLYVALAGEPALGPVAYPHRISAMPSPIAPMTHHWLDSTHISFGVVTAGLYGHRWKAEASVFNGREPDEHRYDLDLGPLDSVSGRIWYLPDPSWAFQASAGRLREAEAGIAGAPRVDVTRATVSATYQRTQDRATSWATTAAWGRNDEHGQGSNAFLGEATLDLGHRNVVFARVEAAQKTAESLAIPGGERERWVAKGALTYVRQFEVSVANGKSALFGLGAGITVNAVPSAFELAYGGRWPVGFALFLSTRAGAMETMPGMVHPQ